MNPVIVIPTSCPRVAAKKAAACSRPTITRLPSRNPASSRVCLRRCRRCAAPARSSCSWSASRRSRTRRPRRFKGVVSRFPSLNTVVIGAPELALIQQRMEQLGLGKLQKEIGLSGYGAVRNLGLVMADVLGFDSVVFLDDDEVVDDADFLQKAMYGWASSRRRAFPSWPRPASTSIPKAPTCRRARTSGTTISGSRERPSTNGSRRPCAALVFPDRTIRAAAALLCIKRRSSVCRSILGSRAAKISITCLTCVCTVRTSGSTISGACATFLPKPRARHALPSGYLPMALRIPEDGVQPHADRPFAGEAVFAGAYRPGSSSQASRSAFV